ncbi:MAG: hypothetical protein QW727_01595 [Candidatus Pacearchaeota archaeon]
MKQKKLNFLGTKLQNLPLKTKKFFKRLKENINLNIINQSVK